MFHIDFEIVLVRAVMSFVVATVVRYVTWELLHEKIDERRREHHSIVTGFVSSIFAVVLSLVGG